jgi:glycosyltransferase involved in cell wall biosynthesis
MSIHPKRGGIHSAWWSAEFGELTGQAIVTARVVGLLSAAGGQGVVYPPGGLRATPSWLAAALRLWRLALLGRVRQLYLVCSRSNVGFLRDLPAYLLVLFGSRVVVHTHGSDIVELCQRPWIGWLARFFMARCLLLLPSAHLVSPLHELGIVNTTCCENFFELSAGQIATVGSAGKKSPHTLTILWNSNVMASKGFFILAEAVKRLVQSGRKVSMMALGRCVGDEVMDVDACATRLQAMRMETWLDYYGPVSRSESTRLLDEADIVCLPSTYASECQPLALIEAMCAARPIIVANTLALCATVGNYPCLKVDVPAQTEALMRAILCCREQTESMSLAEAAQAARERFSPERFDQEMRVLLGLP